MAYVKSRHSIRQECLDITVNGKPKETSVYSVCQVVAMCGRFEILTETLMKVPDIRKVILSHR